MQRSSQRIGICLALALGIGVLFGPVGGYSFVNLDDPQYVTANPHLVGGLTLANVTWAFQTWHTGNWHPVTWLSHLLDIQCFGLNPTGPHLVNVILHIISTVLLFWTLTTLTDAMWPSAFVAALFGWHPLRVETVAWIAERKDVLSGFFFMLTLWAYVRFVKRREAQRPALRWYLLALTAFALGLMSKPMLVTLPFILVLVDYWPLGRLRPALPSARKKAVLWEKIPFFVVTLIFCGVTLFAQKHGGAVQSLTICPVGMRVENTLVSYAKYVAKTFWPFGLATPYADIRYWPLAAYGSAAVLLGIWLSAAVWLGRKHPYVAMGSFWFLGMLVPVIGIAQAGAQSMADRFTYLPGIGLFIVMVWGLNEARMRWRVPDATSATVAGLILAACALRTHDQLRYWRNSESLLTHAVSVTQNNWIAHYNLGWELEHQGRLEEALAHFRQASETQPYDIDTLANLGDLLVKLNRSAEAIPYFEKALKIKPELLELHYQLGEALLHSQKFDEAIEQYRLVLAQKPEHFGARKDLATTLAIKGDLAPAVTEFETVLRTQPDDAESHFNLGEVLAEQGKLAEARAHIVEALRLKPGWAKAQGLLQDIDKSTTKP